jgi:hypothetical protein
MESSLTNDQLIKIIDDIIYNEDMHIVSVFKDYLIYDDIGEFLKRSYFSGEAKERLPRYTSLLL